MSADVLAGGMAVEAHTVVRCGWARGDAAMIAYHDAEWGVPVHDEMSKDLRKRGFKFVGPTICYAFMQAVGMVNDHEPGCFRFAEIAAMPRGG